MPRPAQKARRALERQREREALQARVALLEGVLRDVWLWLSRESDNPELLRQVLLSADRDREVHAALDAAEKGGEG